MFKEQIIAYVTGTINAHTKSSLSKGMMNIKDDTAEEFEKFLDFIEDIPEVKTVSEDTEGMEELEETVRICEERLKIKWKVEEKLRSKITELEKQLEEKNGLEQYADFIKAVRAYRDSSKTITCRYNGTQIYVRTGRGLIDAFGNAVSPYEILEGKWSIEGEEK